MIKSEKIAEVILIITVPLVMVLLLLIILFFWQDTIFTGLIELHISIVLLMLVPLAVYPLASVIPMYKDKEREGQRDVAFILSLVGYIAAIVYGFIGNVTRGLLLIYLSYFFSAVILVVFNKSIMLRASGHACSIIGPMILMVYFIGWRCVFPCVILFTLITWATLKEIIIGCGSATIAFATSLMLTWPILPLKRRNKYLAKATLLKQL